MFGKTFVVAPVTTDLQRRLLGGEPTLAAFASVDGQGLFPDDKSVAFEALNLAGIRSALVGLKPAPAQAAHLQAYYVTQFPSQPRGGRELVSYALEGMGRRAGFGKVTASAAHDYREWGEYVAPLRDATGADAPEASTGDDKAKAYPVRTPLSRVLTGGMAAVVDVRVRLDNGVVTAVPDGLAQSVRMAVRDLRLPRGGKLHVLFNAPSVGLSADAERKLRELAVEWATGEGLEGGTYTLGG